MCFDICAINIRVSIRVRGLHLVFNGKITKIIIFYGKITIFYGKITMSYGKINYFEWDF